MSFNKLLKYIKLVSIIALLIIIFIFYKSYKNLKKDYNNAVINNKAYVLENKNLNGESIEFKKSIAQLRYENDSINKSLNLYIETLKLKDKNIKRLLYVSSQLSKTDTIIINDTIFRDNINIDTLLMPDKWYNIRVKLYYPSTIITIPSFTSELVGVVHSKKETIKPRKSFFILRWFQKKHTIVSVDIIDNNIYSKIKQTRFIEIIE